MAGALAAPAHASWLDSDFYCRVYGCVVVHDGFTFDVYDNYRFSNGSVVQPGEKMVPWFGNPFQGAGAVNPVITGTRTEAFTQAPLVDESTMVGIDRDGDGDLDFQPTANASGFLDASGTLQSFTLTGASTLRADESSAQRSFYMSSRTEFFLAAEVRLGTGNGVALDPAALSQVGFDYGVTLRGNDSGMAFGSNAFRNNNTWDINNVNDLGDLYGAPVFILEVYNEIRRRSADSLPSQSIRFDYVYGFGGYDLSMGTGALDYEIEFSFYNRLDR